MFDGSPSEISKRVEPGRVHRSEAGTGNAMAFAYWT